MKQKKYEIMRLGCNIYCICIYIYIYLNRNNHPPGFFSIYKRNPSRVTSSSWLLGYVDPINTQGASSTTAGAFKKKNVSGELQK